MIEIGRIVIKLAGRDAGREAAVVDILEDNYVLIDGNVRRRKCNILHLEPTSKSIKLKKGASHETVKKEFEKLGLPVWETKPKEKSERPRKVRGKKKLQAEAASSSTKKEKKEKAKEAKKKKAEEAKDAKKEKVETKKAEKKPKEETAKKTVKKAVKKADKATGNKAKDKKVK